MGPGQKPGGNPGMKRRGSRNPGKTLKRLLGYIWKYYKMEFVIVLIAIVISSLAGVVGNLFIKNLIDDYITPFLTSADPTFAPLLRALLVMAVIYYAGTAATYVYARLMINVTQGTLKQIRDEMFTHMEKLPIKYFDTHVHGDIMSCYTNDTDTLRQMISQSIPLFHHDHRHFYFHDRTEPATDSADHCNDLRYVENSQKDRLSEWKIFHRTAERSWKTERLY